MKREARGKKISFLLEDIFSLKEALGECLFGCEQKRMLGKKNQNWSFFSADFLAPQIRESHRNIKAQEEELLTKWIYCPKAYWVLYRVCSEQVSILHAVCSAKNASP